MNFKNFSRKVGGFTLTALMLTGITVFSASEAEAQQRRVSRPVIIVRPVRRVYSPFYRPFGWYNRGWYGGPGWYDYGWNSYARYNRYVFDNSEEAASSAYKQGVKTGEEDGRKNKSFSYERSDHYKDAGFGNFGEVYRRNFARGYESGYQQGVANARAKAAEKAEKERAKAARKAERSDD